MLTILPSRNWVWQIVLSASVVVAYANGFKGVFQLDDIRAIVLNKSVQTLADPLRLFSDPETVTRPVVALTFAIDYALFGPHPAGYHAINLALHVAVALLLFALVRRTLSGSKFSASCRTTAAPLAFCVALLWSLHPLQSETVTYIVQRAESMMGLCFLLSLYCIVRGAESPSKLAWHAGAVAAGVLGAGCKQVIVVLPFVALLYDRCFISGTFAGAWKRASRLYLLLLLPFPIVLLLLGQVPGIGTAGFQLNNATPFQYACTQFVVLVHYLKLVFWPAGLCIDYGWPIERDLLRIVPCAALILTLLGVTLWQLRKNTPLGFCGAFFFLTLAPTSSIMPISDFAVEHRMYLALASVSALVVMGVFRLMETVRGAEPERTGPAIRATVAFSVLLAIALGVSTFQRNTAYFDYVGMWNDVIAKRPENPKAYIKVVIDALSKGNEKMALEYIDKGLAACPDSADLHYGKGQVLFLGRDYPGAITAFEMALRIDPTMVDAWGKLCVMWVERDKGNEAIKAAVFELLKSNLDAVRHVNMAAVLANAKRFVDALFEYDIALKLQPGNESAIANRAKVRERMASSDSIDAPIPSPSPSPRIPAAPPVAPR